VVLTAILGVIAIFLCGIPVLAVYTGWSHVLQLGVLPFIPGEIIKIGMLSSITPWFWRNSQK
jgi:biotin transporter BioY